MINKIKGFLNIHQSDYKEVVSLINKIRSDESYGIHVGVMPPTSGPSIVRLYDGTCIQSLYGSDIKIGLTDLIKKLETASL